MIVDPKKPSGRGSMNKILKLFCVVIFVSGCSDRYPSLESLYRDRSAATQLKAEKYESALEAYYSVLQNNPDAVSTHSNIGNILNLVQKPDEALKSLLYARKLALQGSDSEALFATSYNLGVYFGKKGQVPEALESYQSALDVKPDSIEAKTNIELLLQQNQKNQQGEKNENSEGQDGQNDQKQDGDGKSESDQDKPRQDGNDQKDKKDENKPDDSKRETSPKYKPRPFQGDQLSEGDVKKILGELRNQEQKIRANFDKKEKGKSKSNEKDW